MEHELIPAEAEDKHPWQVPVCGGQNSKAGPISIPGAHRAPPHPTPLHAQAALSNAAPPRQTPAQTSPPPCGLPSPLAILYGPLLCGTLPQHTSVPSGGFFSRPDLDFLKGRNCELQFVSASSKHQKELNKSLWN